MPRDDVDFYADETSAGASDEDTVDLGSRAVPRWVNVGGGALVAAIVIAVVATGPQPNAGTSAPQPSAPPAVVSSAGPSDAGLVGPVLQLDGAPDARDVVVHRNQLFVLRQGGVSVVDLTANRVTWMPLSGAGAVAAAARTQLLFDAGADRLWVLAAGPQEAQLVEFSASRSLAIRRVTLHLRVRAAAATEGHVYLATSTGLADLAPGASSTVALPGARGSMSAVAADPVRSRVVALDSESSGTTVVAVSTHGALTRRSLGHLANGSVAIVGGAIWVAGYDGHAAITRLDPVTLAPVQTSAAAPPGEQVVVAPGTDDVWVSGAGRGLWCIAADTGVLHQYWPRARVPVASQRGHGPVQSRTGSAYAIQAGRLISLDLAGCIG